jgi:hypothetical protein
MTMHPNFDALQSIATHNPPSWRMLRKIPRPALLRYDSDENGQDVFTLNRRNFRDLCFVMGRVFHDAAHRFDETFDGVKQTAAWLRPDGRNLFDDITPERARLIFAPLVEPAARAQRWNPMAHARLALMPTLTAYALAVHTARRHGLVSARVWFWPFVQLWMVGMTGSLYMSIDISQAEMSEMFDALPDRFPLCQIYKSRRALPDEITLYRGIAVATNPPGPGEFLGYSWTDSPDVARHYALDRFSHGLGSPYVMTATFERSDVATIFQNSDRYKNGATYHEFVIYPDAKPRDFAVNSVHISGDAVLARISEKLGLGTSFRAA